MTTTNPEQWAVELWRDICTAIVCSKPYDKDTAAALTIQAAFAEREARLAEALKAVEAAMVRGGDGRVLEVRAILQEQADG